ncbi:MAG: NUDIX domain-containing protein [Treponema sp.]|nr:NUDIX domain-containing protein [Treponema sp.]
MFKFCPSCASPEINFERNKFRCSSCGFVYYHNTAAATACVVRIPGAGDGPAGEERILFLVRGREPGRGKLDLPGGFVDPGEGALEGLRRELREELGWEPPGPSSGDGSGPFVFLASFPNVYPYRGIVYNTCDLFFTVSAPGLCEKTLEIEQSEVHGLRFLRRGEIDPADIAFDSVKRALSAYDAWKDREGKQSRGG